MITIKIFYIGKTKEAWLNEAIAEYEKRLRSDVEIRWILLKNDKDLEEALSFEPHYISLDPIGKMHTSPTFSTFITAKASHIFVIGGPEGIPPHLKKNGLSFSPMTFTHQMIRLLLIEQIYRAIQIHKNTPYHK